MTPTSPVPANPPQGSVPSYRPVSMNWFILEAAQNSRILSVGATPVLLFTSCLTPFVELLNGATQASRNLVNFQFTRSMKSLTSAFWYSIANVPMGIIAVATTPFDKGRWARNSYPASMIPGDARSPAHLPTQVIDKDAIERDIKREADLKEQVAILRGLLTTEQNEKLDLRLGYEAQFTKALELIGKRIAKLQIAADAETLEDACNEIYEGAINSLWNLLSKEHQNVVNDRYPSGELKAKYELVSQIIATEYQNTSIGFNRHVNNTINLIATLAGIDTIPLDSKPDQGLALINNLVQKLSEPEKQEFQTVREFPNQIRYLFDKLCAAAIKKAGEEALLKDNVVNLRKQFAENLELLTQTTENLDKTQKALDAQTQLVQEKEQKLLELTQTYNIAKKSLEELEKGLPQDTKQLVEKIENLKQQHEHALNRLKSDHETAIEKLTQTIDEKQEVIDQTGNKNLEFTTTIEEQKKRIEALESEYAKEIKELKQSHAIEITGLTNENTTQISRLKNDHQEQITEIKTQLSSLHKEQKEQINALQKEHTEEIKELKQSHALATEELTQDKTTHTTLLKTEHETAIRELKIEHETAIRELKEEHKREIQELQHNLKQTINGINSDLKFSETEHKNIVDGLKQKAATDWEMNEKALNEDHRFAIDALKQLHDVKETELTKLHREKIEKLTEEHKATREKAIKAKEDELTQEITKLKRENQTIVKDNETRLNELHQAQEKTVKANTTLQQELEKSKEAVAQSQERARQLEDTNKEQLILIENLTKQLKEATKVTVENQNNLSLPTQVIPSVSPAETKEETPEPVVAAIEEVSSEPRPTTPPSADAVKELAATGISTPEKAQRVPLQDMTNTSSPLSDLLKQLNELKPEKIGVAMSNERGYKLTPVLQKTAQDTIENLDTNVSEFQNISENWKQILDARTQRQKKNNSAPVIPKAKFEEFVSNIRKTQQT